MPEYKARLHRPWREHIGIVSPACTMRGLRRTIMALPSAIHRANGI